MCYFVSHWFSILAISRLWKQCHDGQWRAVGISYIFHYFFIILALASLNALAQKALSAQTGQIVQQQKKWVITDSIQIFELFCFRVWTHKPCAASSLLLSSLLELWPHLPPLGQELKVPFVYLSARFYKTYQTQFHETSHTHRARGKAIKPKSNVKPLLETLSSKKVVHWVFRSLGASSGK